MERPKCSFFTFFVINHNILVKFNKKKSSQDLKTWEKHVNYK